MALGFRVRAGAALSIEAAPSSPCSCRRSVRPAVAERHTSCSSEVALGRVRVRVRARARARVRVRVRVTVAKRCNEEGDFWY